MLVLTGQDLSLDDLLGAASEGTHIKLSQDGLDQMRKGRAVIDTAIAGQIPIYGVTTGLGARVTETLDAETLAGFSLQTLRGRAHAIGKPYPRAVVRAAMILRANTLLLGHAGARTAVAEHIVACLNAGLTPVVGEIGSIGAADLIPNATLGLSLVGEGLISNATGQTGPSSEMMRAAGIVPLELGSRDGLALANHSSVVVASAAIGLGAAHTSFIAAQCAAALSLQAFGANLTPLTERFLKLRPLPGQMLAAEQLQHILAGSHLWQPGQSRRLQDPLSFRNIPQIHGTVAHALTILQAILDIEINGSSDNPAVLPESGDVCSTGNYFMSELANAIDTTNRAFVHLTVAQLARISKHLNPVFSDLPVFLALPESGSNGFAPVMKTAEAVVGELLNAAQAGQIWPSINANGVEDCMSGAPIAAKSLNLVAALSAQLTAVELIVAAQALDLRHKQPRAMGAIAELQAWVRTLSPPLNADRPLGADLMKIAAEITDGRLSELKFLDGIG